MPARTILLVDDDPSVRVTCAALLEDDGHLVVEAASLAEARCRIADTRIDVALVDLHLPDGLGTTLAADLRARHPAAPLVLLSGAEVADGADVDLVLTKGVDPLGLGARLEEAIARRAARR